MAVNRYDWGLFGRRFRRKTTQKAEVVFRNIFLPEVAVNRYDSFEGVFPHKVAAEDDSPQYQKVVDVSDYEPKPRV